MHDKMSGVWRMVHTIYNHTSFSIFEGVYIIYIYIYIIRSNGPFCSV